MGVYEFKEITTPTTRDGSFVNEEVAPHPLRAILYEPRKVSDENNKVIWFCMGWNAGLGAADEFAKGLVQETNAHVYMSRLRPMSAWYSLEGLREGGLTGFVIDQLGLAIGDGMYIGDLKPDMHAYERHIQEGLDLKVEGITVMGHSQSSALMAHTMGQKPTVTGMVLTAPYPSCGSRWITDHERPAKHQELLRYITNSIPLGPTAYGIEGANVRPDLPVHCIVAEQDDALKMSVPGTRDHFEQELRQCLGVDHFSLETVPGMNHNFNPVADGLAGHFNKENKAGLVEKVAQFHKTTCK